MPENHGPAELYEILVARILGDSLGLETNVTDVVVEEKQLLAADRGPREELRAPIGAGVLRKYFELLSPARNVRAVTWTGGGARSSYGSAADLEVVTNDGEVFGFQLKSVGTGLGTMRNPYNDVLLRRVNVDASEIVGVALSECLDAIRDYFPDGTPDPSTFAQLYSLRSAMPKDQNRAEMEARAKAAYQPTKRKLCEAFVEGFNSLPNDRRSELMSELMGIEEGKNLELLVHDDRGCRLLSHSELANSLREFDLIATVNTDNSLVIGAFGKSYFRLNSSASNAQGVSSPAWRIFYLPDAESLFVDLAS